MFRPRQREKRKLKCVYNVKKECEVGGDETPLPHCLLVRSLLWSFLFFFVRVFQRTVEGVLIYLCTLHFMEELDGFLHAPTHACMPYMSNPSVPCVYIDNYCLELIITITTSTQQCRQYFLQSFFPLGRYMCATVSEKHMHGNTKLGKTFLVMRFLSEKGQRSWQLLNCLLSAFELTY